jgi:hypothetical protein
MKRHFTLLVALTVLSVVPLAAQRPEQRQEQRPAGRQGGQSRPHANQGHIPPAPAPRAGRSVEPQRESRDGGRVNSMPHVSHNQWYGHDRPNDSRFRVARPYAGGRFEHIGPSYRYNVSRFDAPHRRFWLGGFGFEVAAWDWAEASDWCWNCNEDDLVVYDDPDHPGWYLIYNVHTGEYVHAQGFAG